MGRTRGGRRHVLQLNDNKESYLAKYGYSRQEEEEDDDDDGSDKEAEEEETIPVDPHKGPPDTPDIDDKVANFLAEIQAIDPEDEEEERPSFKNGGGVSIPPPTFSLNANQQQQPSPGRSPEPELPPPKKTVNAYRSMFVKGESEFVRKQEDVNIPKTVTEEVEWPEEPTTVWQQTLDENTQFHYYWNTVTNEVTWEIPPEFTQYLLLYKEYEEKVEKLKKEGKTKPPPKAKEEDRNGAVPVIPGDLEAISSSAKAVCDPPYNGHTSVVPEGSVTSSSEAVTDSNEAPSSILKNKNDSPATVLPDSTNSKSKTPQLVAYHGGSSDESSTDSSEDSENSDNEEKKPAKQSKDQDTDDMDLDDIDKALEMALEKKKTSKEHKSKSKSSESSKSHKKSSDKAPKTKSLVDAMREHVQQKQEVEARRKAAIEEMMARELERRVGPPRKRPTPEEPSLHGDWESSKRAKVMEYEHGRRSRRGEEYEHSLSKSSQDKDYDRDSRHKRDDHKKHKKDDRDRKRDDGKKRDEHGKRKHEEKKKDEKKKHKDKDRDREKDDRKKDKKKEKQKDEDKVVQEEKQSEEKRDVKKEQSKVSVKKDEEEAEVPKVKKELHTAPSTEKKKDSYAEYMESNLTAVQLANLKLQASELVELALSKLEFLEVTKKGLSKLQILLVELETRQHDWQNGGLSTEYFLLKLEEANRQLQQYEQSAAPPGWSCHWDRAYRRYFYMNKKSNRTQWDYPDDDEEEDVEENIENSRHSTSSSPSREQSFDDEVSKKSETVLESCDETSKMDVSHPDTKSKRHSRKHRHDGHEAKDENQSETSPKRLDSTRTGDPNNEVESMATEKACSDEDVSMDNEPVSSSTASILPDTDSVTADTTTSVITAMEEIFQGKSNYSLNKSEPQPPLPAALPSQSFDFTSTTATVSVLQGQPPPPGTDLDFLLAAPPPPPPPPPEGPSGVTMETADSYDLNTPVLMETHVASYPSLDMESMVHSSDMDSAAVHPSEVVSSDQMYDSEAPGVLPVEQTETAVIARPPQVFSRDSHVIAEPVSSVETSSSEPYLPEAAGPSGDVPSSSGIYSEKKKKKKDKSMSSSGLHLKKKNVSSLVQKWQKVKKEVEIEERHREERDQAIRQKLEEWKQEYN